MRTSTSSSFGRSMLAKIGLALLLCAAVAAPLWQWRTIAPLMPASHSDFVPVRVGAQIALRGGDPYSEDSTREIQRFYYGRPLVAGDDANKMGFAYPLHTAILLAPLALMPWNVFRLSFLLVMPVLLAASVPLWLSVLRLRRQTGRLRTVVLAILFVASWPAVWALRQQQVTLIVAILLGAGCYLLQRGWDGSAGVVLALSTMKPQLAGLLLLWLVLWTLLRRRFRFAVALLTTTGALIAVALWRVPGWIPHWFAAMSDYAHYTHARPVLQILLGDWPGAIMLLAIGCATLTLLWRVRACEAGSMEFGQAIGLVLAATVSVNPTYLAMIYNQVLLLPACLIVVQCRPQGYYARLTRVGAVMLMGWGYLVTAFSATGEALGHQTNFWFDLPYQNSLLPAAVVLALGMLLQERLQAAALTADLGRAAVLDAA